MKSYRLRPEFVARTLRKNLVGPLIFGLVIVAMVVAALMARGPLTASSLTCLVPVALAFVAFIAWTVRRQTLGGWGSYRLDLDEVSVSRVQAGYPELVIRREEITRIVETPAHWLVVYAAEKGLQITIPEGVEDYEEIRSRLSTWQPIEPASQDKTRTA